MEFKCVFLDEIGDETWTIMVQRADDKISVTSVHTSKKTTLKFDAIEAAVAYLRTLVRMHLEDAFEETYSSSISIRHVGGEINLMDAPGFKYQAIVNKLTDKKIEFSQALKENKEPNMFYYILNKLGRIDRELAVAYKKHRKELVKLKRPYIQKMVETCSEIFHDLLVLIQDAQEVASEAS